MVVLQIGGNAAVLLAPALAVGGDLLHKPAGAHVDRVDVLAGVPYIIKAQLYITTTATPGFQMDFAGGTTTIAAGGFKGRSTFSTAAAAALAYVDPTALNTANNPAAAAYTLVDFEGVLLPATSGTFGIRWAQSVTNAVATTVNLMSYLRADPAVSLFGR